jgi:hypothetical protein
MSNLEEEEEEAEDGSWSSLTGRALPASGIFSEAHWTVQ